MENFKNVINLDCSQKMTKQIFNNHFSFKYIKQIICLKIFI